MTELLSLVLAGAVAGGLYAIMASGLVLTYQTSGIFNVGHGAIAFATALVFHVLHQPGSSGGMGLPTVLAGVLAICVFAPLLGVGLDVTIFRRLAGASETARLVGAIGVLIALPALVLFGIDAINAVFGTRLPTAAGEAGISPPGLGPFPAKSFSLTTGVSITSDQLAVLAAAALTAAGLWYMLRRTRLGLETRAAVDRPALARLRGVDTDRASRVVWALTAMLAGLAGVLIAPLFDLSALTFHMIVFISITAAVAARMRSVPVAFAAGIGLGVVQNLVYGYAPDSLASISGFRASVPFILLFVLMFVLPSRGREAGSVAEDAPPADPRADLGPWRRRAPWLVAGVLLVLWAFFVADPYWMTITQRGLVLALVFLSFVLVTGHGGMVNLAQATFVTVGGFTAGWLVNHQWPSTVPILMNNGRFTFWLAVIAAVAATAAVGALVALPSLRLGGLALALATLALAFIGDRLVFQLEGVRNGSRGWSLRRPAYGFIDLGDDRTLFVVLLLLVVGVVGVLGNLHRSATGRAVLALRSSPVAAATSGVDPTRTKVTVFVISAALAGFAGAFFALVNSPMTNISAPPLLGMVWLAVAVTFGIRRPGGAVVGGLVFAAVPALLDGVGKLWTGAPWSWLPDTVRQLLGEPVLASVLFGLGAVGLARQPDGILADVGHAMASRRRRRTAVDGAHVADAVPDPGGVSDEARSLPGQAPADAALALVDVRAGYGDVEVLHGLSLEVAPGQVLAVVGPNGAGKSTLCAVAAGLVAPSAGQVLLAGTDITAEAPHQRARAGMLLAPEARGVFPGLSVADNLALWLRSEDDRRAVTERFPILAERSHQLAGLLSGGEQQQLAIAVALGDPPRVFVADEPTLGLAPMAVRTVLEGLAELRDRGTAVVLVEEQATAVLDLADTVAVVELGRVTWSGPAADVDVADLTASYLGD